MKTKTPKAGPPKGYKPLTAKAGPPKGYKPPSADMNSFDARVYA